MNLTISQKGLVLVSLPLLFQLAFVLLLVQLQREYADAQYWAAHTKEIIAQVQELRTNIVDAQSAARGATLTGDPAFAAPYDRAAGELPAALDRLGELLVDNPEQAARADAIRADATALLAWLGEEVRLARNGATDTAAARIRSGDGKRRMEELHRGITAFLAEEERLDRERAVALERSRARLNGMLLAGGVLAGACTFVLAYLFRRGIGRRFAALTENTRRLAAGKELPPPLPGSDEIARLDRVFRDMAAELTRASDRIRDLYDNAPCGYHSVDPDGTIVAVNRTELRWLGYEAGDLIGRKKFIELLAPDDRAAYRAAFGRLKAEGAVAGLEVELLRRDGTTLPVLIGSTAVRDADGRYVASRTTLTDLTERKGVEETLRRSEERFRLLIDGVRDYAIFMLDPDGVVASWNPGAERINGYAAGEIVGRHFSAFYPPGDVAAGKTETELRAAAAEGRYEEEGWRVRKDGSRFWAGVLITALSDPDGRLVGFVKVTRDLTERKKAEDAVRQLNSELEGRVRERTAELAEANEELVQKNAENEMFVYSVSHDLRSPLVNLQGFSKELDKGCQQLAGLLADDGVPPAVRDRAGNLLGGKMAKSVGFIQTAVLRLSTIIDALLRLSRAGRVEYRREAVDVAGVVGRVVTAAQGTVAEKGAVVRVGELPTAWGDRAAVEQVFANLIGNALTYLDPIRPGVVEVGCQPEGSAGASAGYRTYFVRDNGLGIPEAHRAKIFQAFQRAHPGVGSGEGLGLAIVARVVERHRGRVWVESQPGEGSTFFVSLPADRGGQ